MRVLPVVISLAAAFDIADATTGYESTRLGLGREFLDELQRARLQIERFPAGSQQVHGDVRRCLMRRFPFGVLYRVLPDCIQIIAVFPTQSDPAKVSIRASVG